MHQRDSDTTIDISTHPGVGLLPPGCQDTGKAFYHFLGLHANKSTDRDKKGEEMEALLDTGLHVLQFSAIFHIQEKFLQRLVLIGQGGSIQDMHVVNTARPFLPEIADQYPPFLLRLVLTG